MTNRLAAAALTVTALLTACGTHDQDTSSVSTSETPTPETVDYDTYDLRVDIMATNYGWKWYRNVKCPPTVVWQPGETFQCLGVSKLSGIINEKITVYMLSEVGDYDWSHTR